MDMNERIIDAQGKQMNTISFGELVKELTGASFDEVYKDYLNKGDGNVERESNVE
jgi:hypothetical protein